MIGKTFFYIPISAVRRQMPWPLQVPFTGHLMYWHASPAKPSAHVHAPVAVSQIPMFEHSVRFACAVSVASLKKHIKFSVLR